jgi:predicted lactoylglutathione lyase
MNTEAFFTKVRTYTDLSTKAELTWSRLLRPRQYSKEELFIRAGDVPTACAFVVEGLLCQHYVGRDGDLVIKYLFPENRIAASVSATKWSGFTSRPIPPATSSEVMLAISCESREAVDRMNDAATAEGGEADINPKQDLGFLYNRSLADPDGHVWEAIWMDPSAMSACG